MTTNASEPIRRPDLLVRRGMTSCRCHGETWVVGCKECGRDAFAWRHGRPGQQRTSGWKCIACGAVGGLWGLTEAA